MPKYIPGNPNIIVQNMPGAEGIKAANYLSTIAARDGTILGGLQRNTGLANFYQPRGSTIQFDPQKFTWLGSLQQEVGFLLVRPASGVTDAAGLKTKEITSSSTSRNSPSSIYPRMLNELYGTKIRVIDGYGGSQESLLALERGEVDAHVSGGSSAAFRAPLRALGEAGPRQGDPANGHGARPRISRHPDRARDRDGRRRQEDCSRSPSSSR